MMTGKALRSHVWLFASYHNVAMVFSFAEYGPESLRFTGVNLKKGRSLPLIGRFVGTRRLRFAQN